MCLSVYSHSLRPRTFDSSDTSDFDDKLIRTIESFGSFPLSSVQSGAAAAVMEGQEVNG